MNKKVNHPDQLAYIRRYVLTEGEQAGLKIVEVNTGKLRFLLNESKALDVAELWHGGTNISLLSKNGLSMRETSFLKRFEGGALYTCGIDVIGGVPGYEDHGSFHNIPALISRAEIDGEKIIVEGTVRDGLLFGKNLAVKRRYETSVLGESLTLTDTLINLGYSEEKYSLLYHVNVGYPMLDEGDKICAEVNSVDPRTPYADKCKKDAFLIETPVDGCEETCYFLDLKKPCVSLTNDKIKKRYTLSFDKTTLPYFVEWKSRRSGDYALGLEPSTSLLDDKFRFSTIKPQEKITFSVTVSVNDIK